MSIRWQLRWFFLSLMTGGVLWLHLTNYVRLNHSPLDMWRLQRTSTLVLWFGALALGLLIDGLAGLSLRHFFAAVRRQAAGQSLSAAEALAAAGRAIRFPEQAARTLVGCSLLLIVIFHLADTPRLPARLLTEPSTRLDLFHLVLRELLLAVTMALLLYLFSRRILQKAVASLGLREVPEGPRLSTGVRFALVVLAQAFTYVSLFVSIPKGTPPERMIWLYVPLGLLSLTVAYLVAGETGRDLQTIAGRLRVLAAGVRPGLFQRLPVTGRDEVAELVAAINVLQDRVEGEFRALERDLQAARTIQTEMLPRAWAPPPGWQLAARLVPAQAVGGDFYDIIVLAPDRWAVAVGDAAGKGLPAALLMASVVSLLRSHARWHHRPAQVLEAVNRLLCTSLPPMTFVTAVYAVVDVSRREVTLASAGHLPPLAGRGEWEPLSSLPLGVDPEAAYPERTYALRPGEPLVLFSDGLVEVPGPDGQPLGTQWVLERLRQAPAVAEQLADDLLASVMSWRAGRPPTDDVTVLVLVPPAELRLELPCRHGAELEAAAEAARFAQAHGFARRAEDVATAVGEVCLNAIVHGNGLCSPVPVVLHLLAGPDWLEAKVTDLGQPFSLPAKAPDLQAQMEGDGPIRGWGLQWALATADSLTVEPLPVGKLVRLRFTAEPQAADVVGP